MASYENYVKRFPAPLNEAMEARQKLADYAKDTGNVLGRREVARRHRRRRSRGGRVAERPQPLSRGARDARTHEREPRCLPVHPAGRAAASGRSPTRRRRWSGRSPVTRRRPRYAVAEVTTAATYEMGELYRRLAADLMKSERPANLDARGTRAVRPAARGAGLPVRGEGGRDPRVERAHAPRTASTTNGCGRATPSSRRSSLRASASGRAGGVHDGTRAALAAAGRRPPAPVDRAAEEGQEGREAPRPCRRLPAIAPATSSSSRKPCACCEAGDFPAARPILENSSRRSRRSPRPP